MFLRRATLSFLVVFALMVSFLPGTALGPRPVAAATLCNSAQFIADVTIPDGTTIAPGATFVKTWRLMNNGTCTWTTAYDVVFVSGTQMGSPATIAMPSSIAPGGTVDITVNLTAPTTPGHYRGNYKLQDGSNNQFGVGLNAAFLFWVDINVATGAGLTTAYDFTANVCSATWSNATTTLPCPGTDGDTRGFVLSQANPVLENGTTSTVAGLAVNPQMISGGVIQGIYPAFTVQAGDRFQTIVNCANGATSCYVNFRLDYQVGGVRKTFWSFNERNEGLFFRANLDLSALAGQSVNFILYVADVPGHGTPSGDRATWVGPIIARGGGTSTPIPPTSVCNLGEFIADVTIPDGTIMPPNQAFTKTWRIRNVGTCTWTTSYSLVFVFGNTFGAPTTINLPAPVAPGATADFSINMVAPSIAGHYRSYWRFKDQNGVQFGVGSGMITFFADINVQSGAPTLPPGGTPGPTPTQIITGPNADLAVTVSDGGISTYTPGGTVTYTVTVTNFGPNDVVGATFTDNKPSPAVTSWTVTCVPDTGATCTTGPTTPGNILDIVNIPAGKKIVYTIAATINASAVGNLVNTASITNPAAVPDPNLANNSATDTDAPPSTDLSVTMSDNVTMYTLGGSVTYTIQLANAGPLPVTGATFTDPKPSQITTWTWNCVTAGGAVWSGPGTTTGNVTATVNMPVSSTITCTVVATVSSAATGDLVNTATITSPVGVPDAVPANNSATHTDTGPSADLSVTKTDGVTYYTPGGTLTYTITVANAGPLIVNGATFTDNMPTGITSWTWSCLPDTGASGGVNCTTAPTPFVNFTDTLTIPAGNKVVYTVVATVDPLATASIINTASVASSASIPDLNPANNTATDTDSPPSADLAVTISDGVAYYTPNGSLTYTIDVRNNGPQAVTLATVNVVKPAQILSWTWACAADPGASCTMGPGPSVLAGDFTDTVTIPAGAKVRYTAAATINVATTGDLVTTVTVADPAGIADPNLANNTAADTDLHPIADLAVTITDMVNTYTANDTVIYTITVTNNGPSNVVGATLSSAFPINALDWTWTCAPQTGASCTTVGVLNALPFSDALVNIPAGKQVIYTVVTHTIAAPAGPLTVSATIASPTTAPLDVPDSNPANNSATDIDTLVTP